ncbi:MAG: hypothetical protein ACT4P3_18910 [Betaproteobacteria bacterium]
MMPVDDTKLEAELESWDWARTAGVSAEELREALRNSLGGAELAQPRIAKAA